MCKARDILPRREGECKDTKGKGKGNKKDNEAMNVDTQLPDRILLQMAFNPFGSLQLPKRAES